MSWKNVMTNALKRMLSFTKVETSVNFGCRKQQQHQKEEAKSTKADFNYSSSSLGEAQVSCTTTSATVEQDDLAQTKPQNRTGEM